MKKQHNLWHQILWQLLTLKTMVRIELKSKEIVNNKKLHTWCVFSLKEKPWRDMNLVIHPTEATKGFSLLENSWRERALSCIIFLVTGHPFSLLSSIHYSSIITVGILAHKFCLVIGCLFSTTNNMTDFRHQNSNCHNFYTVMLHQF